MQRRERRFMECDQSWSWRSRPSAEAKVSSQRVWSKTPVAPSPLQGAAVRKSVVECGSGYSRTQKATDMRCVIEYSGGRPSAKVKVPMHEVRPIHDVAPSLLQGMVEAKSVIDLVGGRPLGAEGDRDRSCDRSPGWSPSAEAGVPTENVQSRQGVVLPLLQRGEREEVV